FRQLEIEEPRVEPALRQDARHDQRNALFPELDGREVDTDPQWRLTGTLPGLRLAAGRLEHPLVDRQDHAVLFRARQELTGADDAAARPTPAQQGLGPDDAPRPNIDLRLIEQRELLLLDRLPQGVV